MKKCNTCGIEKDESGYYKSRGKYPAGCCKACHAIKSRAWMDRNPEVRRRVARNWYHRHKGSGRIQAKASAYRTSPRGREVFRNSLLSRFYGLTQEQYLTILAKQNNACAICKRGQEEVKSTLNVDHRHSGPRKGEVTGILCVACNRYLVGRHWNPELFQSAANYLRQGTGHYLTEEQMNRHRKRRKKKH